MGRLFILLFFLPQGVFAKTIFEPHLGLTRGLYQDKIAGSSDLTNGAGVEAAYTSFTLGIRYGITRRYIHVTGFAEGTFSNVDGIEIENTTTLPDQVKTGLQTLFNVGLGIGYEWNIPLRTYVLIGNNATGIDLSYYFSSGFLLGIKFNRLKTTIADFNGNVNTFGLAMSFPIEFEYPTNWFRKRDWE